MMTIGRIVRGYPNGQADLEVPKIAEGNVLPRVAMLPLLGIRSQPQAGDRVLVYHFQSIIRWLPITDELEIDWLTSTRRGLLSPKGRVVVVLDDADDSARIGSAAAANPLALGDVTRDLLANLIDLIVNHKHIGVGGSTSTPENVADFLALKASPIQDDAMLSNVAFTERREG